jgi:hypothetical protein
MLKMVEVMTQWRRRQVVNRLLGLELLAARELAAVGAVWWMRIELGGARAWT